MNYSFEWDPEKARVNAAKHGIKFDEAISVFGDPLASWEVDERVYAGEERYIALGRSSLQRLLVVVFTQREARIRIISARKPTRREAQAYEG
ncbi:MAG TPA: BrnT family toxin [Longimicrobium sp.]